MSFLNPMMLAGLVAVGIPIVIHLLNRRQFRRVVWAAMRFLQEAVEQNRRRMRVEDLILLVVRCLLVALLALALARPALFSDAAARLGRSKVTATIILDHSASMGMSDGTNTRFERARLAAEQIIDSLPAGSAAAVLLASDDVAGAIPEPTLDLNLARKVIREAPLTDRGTDLWPALRQAIEMLRERLVARREIYLITDGQAIGWRQLPEIQRALERARHEISTRIILINEHEEKNLGLDDLQLGGGLCPVRQPLRFDVRVSNRGRQEAREIRVSLQTDREPPGDEFTIDRLPPGATRGVTLFGRLHDEGYHTITARLAGDRLAADDQRTIAVRAIRDLKVLLVDGAPADEPRESETFFLKHAFVPVAEEAANDYFIKVAVVTGPELSQARLDSFDAVVLANVADFGDSTVAALDSFVRRGGGLMVFPGDKIRAEFYNRELFERVRLLPATFGEIKGREDVRESVTALQAGGYDHPITTLWNDPAAGTLASAQFFKRYELQPRAIAPPGSGNEGGKTNVTAEAGAPRIVLKYQNGAPAVVEQGWGLGTVLQFSSTADTAWNDLPVRPAWVPLLHRALGALAGRQDQGLNVRVGDTFSRRVPAELLGQEVVFQGPEGAGGLGEMRRVEMQNGWPILTFTRTDLGGRYEARMSDPPFHLQFAAQADPAESSLEELSAAQVAGLSAVSTIVPWSGAKSLRHDVESGRTGVEFWVPLVVLCLLLAGCETVLAHWFSRSR